MRKILKKWWNSIAYVDIYLSKGYTELIVRIPKKDISNLKTHTRCGIGYLDTCEINFKNTTEWIVYKKEDNYVEYIGKGFYYSSFYKKILTEYGYLCKQVVTYYKWYRTCIGIFKSKPYIKIYRDNTIYHVRNKNSLKYKK